MSSRNSRSLGTVIYINVYDLHPSNDWLHWAGLGAYHSGIEINGTEYTFGQHSGSWSGVFDHEPRGAAGAIFRETIIAGITPLKPAEIDRALDTVRAIFVGNEYNMLNRNCNSFAARLCQELKVPYPSWINRLAALGRCCRCCLPAWINEAAPVPNPESEGGFDNINSNNNNTAQTTLASSNSFKAFTGSGYSMINTAESNNNSNNSNRLSTGSTDSTDSYPHKVKSTTATKKELAAAAEKERIRAARLSKLTGGKGENYSELKEDHI